MKKRILSLAAVLVYAAVSVFGSSNVFASQGTSQTHVQPPSGSYVKTVIIDDDFENRAVGDKINAANVSSYSHPVISSGTAGQINGDESNKYYESTANGTYEKFSAKSASDFSNIDRLAISMDLTNPYALSGENPNKTVANPVIYINNLAMFRLNLNEKTTAQGLEVTYFASDGKEAYFVNASGATAYTNKRAVGSSWSHIDIVLKRTLNSDGSTYSVELEKLNVNGNELYLGEGSKTPRFVSADWWTSNTSSSAIFRFGNANLTYMIDNVLVYEPYAEGEQPVDPVDPVEPDGDEVKTNVTRPTYLPEVGTIIVDENFETSTATGSTVTSDYQYSLKDFTQDTSASPTYGLVTEGANKYGKFNIWGKIYPKGTGPVDSDRFVISLDAKCSVENGFNIYFAGNTTDLALRLWFENYADDANKLRLFLLSGKTTDTKCAEAKLVNKNEFIKISVVCKKVNVNGVDKAILSEAYINSDKLTLLDDVNTRYFTTNWFSTAEGTWPVAIGNFTVAGAAALDDILVYAPLKFKASGAELSNDGLTANITFNGTIGNIDSASVTAVDMFGNTINSTLTAEGSTLTATFDRPVNIQDKVYTFTVSGVKDSNGEVADTLTAVYGTGIASIDYNNAKVYINNNLQTAIDGNYIIAAYDSSDKFLGATLSEVYVPVNALGTVSDVQLPNTATEPAKYRLFIWSKASNMPYCGYTEIIPSEVVVAE